MPKPKIVFFGSGPVAAESLKLLAEWCEIEAVITKPRPEHHREEFPVITIAQARGFKLITASNRRELDEATQHNNFTSRAAVLIDFGIIVSQAVIDSFELGIINSHFSLLPEWRGADPITFSILSGQHETGVSLMLLVAAMDEGPLLAQSPYTIPKDCTTPELTATLIEISDTSLQHMLPLYLDGVIQPAPQDATDLPGLGHVAASYSRKLTKTDGVLDFAKPAAQLEREIRAYAEWPRSRTQLAGKDVIITQARTLDMTQDDEHYHDVPGTAFPTTTSNDSNTTSPATERAIAICCKDHSLLVVTTLKPAGKGEMNSAAFLAGNQL